MMKFEKACELYETAARDAGHVPQQPGSESSGVDQRGRWTLRNVRGFLAFVTPGGQVLDARLRPIAEPSA